MQKTMTSMCLLLAPLATGCGSIIHGPEQKITFHSTPSGAQVIYDGGVRGITPCEVNLKRRPLKNIVVIRKDGFADRKIEVDTGVSMWALLGNAVIGGIPGWIIDAATGSFGNIYTETYSADLMPAGEQVSSRDAANLHPDVAAVEPAHVAEGLEASSSPPTRLAAQSP